MHELEVAGQRFTIDRATRQDVAAIVRLLADDVLGAGREAAADSAYEAAFDVIDADPHQYLAVIKAAHGEVVGTFQLTLIPGLARGGTKRLQIEAVRLASETRESGVGNRHRRLASRLRATPRLHAGSAHDGQETGPVAQSAEPSSREVARRALLRQGQREASTLEEP